MKSNDFRTIVVALAIVLSLFNGGLGLLAQMMFTGAEPLSLWISIILPAFLWIPAIAAGKFPRTGLVVFVVIFIASVVSGAYNFRYRGLNPWISQIDNLRFAGIGGLLLIVNVCLARLAGRATATPHP